MSERLRDELIVAAGGHRQAARVLRRLVESDLLAVPGRVGMLIELADAIEQADEIREPYQGDRVILRGSILALIPDLGLAHVLVDRADPDGQGWISVQAGGLEYDSAAAVARRLHGGEVSQS